MYLSKTVYNQLLKHLEKMAETEKRRRTTETPIERVRRVNCTHNNRAEWFCKTFWLLKTSEAIQPQQTASINKGFGFRHYQHEGPTVQTPTTVCLLK